MNRQQRPLALDAGFLRVERGHRCLVLGPRELLRQPAAQRPRQCRLGVQRGHPIQVAGERRVAGWGAQWLESAQGGAQGRAGLRRRSRGHRVDLGVEGGGDAGHRPGESEQVRVQRLGETRGPESAAAQLIEAGAAELLAECRMLGQRRERPPPRFLVIEPGREPEEPGLRMLEGNPLGGQQVPHIEVGHARAGSAHQDAVGA